MASPAQNLEEYISPGDVLGGEYEVEGVVGYGAFGAIFSAIDGRTGERVAIKALPPSHVLTSETAEGRFHRELKVISKLVQDNLITLYDYGETEDGIFFMILEYVDGETLDDVVRGDAVSLVDALQMTRQIALALDHAHGHGVIHRDLKPANIMVSRTRLGPKIKVLDFGMAKVLARLGEDSIQELTREGMAVGTPRYIAPEQARGEDIGPWTDLYALGLLFYEMVTGARAVKSDTVEGAVGAHVSPEPLDLQEIDRVPDRARPILFRLIDKVPSNRYQSARGLIAEIDEILRDEGVAINSPNPGFYKNSPRPPEPESTSAPIGSTTGPQFADVSASEHQQRPPAQEEEMELDWERFAEYADPARDEARPTHTSRQSSSSWLRGPETGFEWAESVIAPLLFVFGFVLLTAQIRTMGYAAKLGIGLSAPVAALALYVTFHADSWRYHFFRLLSLFSLAHIAIAHALGPQRLVDSLFRNPSWFLVPFEKLPFVEAVATAVDYVFRRYASALSSML
ncbi:MAG: serine/threonine protein kinase [Myxococcota bacterium]